MYTDSERDSARRATWIRYTFYSIRSRERDVCLTVIEGNRIKSNHDSWIMWFFSLCIFLLASMAMNLISWNVLDAVSVIAIFIAFRCYYCVLIPCKAVWHLKLDAYEKRSICLFNRNANAKCQYTKRVYTLFDQFFVGINPSTEERCRRLKRDWTQALFLVCTIYALIHWQSQNISLYHYDQLRQLYVLCFYTKHFSRSISMLSIWACVCVCRIDL